MAISGDSGMAKSGEQDATMIDIGEKDRPPGDPPDTPISWARRVSSSNVGGMSTPESILADDFVNERLRLDFPNGEDGEPVITIGREVLEVMNGLWKNCMIVKVLGRSIPISILQRKLKELWKPRGAMYVMDLPRQFFMVRFEVEEEYLAALTGGPWRAFGSCLTVQAWSPEFDPLKDEIVTTPVWVRISNIPVNFYHKAILLGIARGLGKPLKVDLTTLKFERARFARVCVEVNLQKPLKGTVLINGERYFVSYEGLPNICPRCGIYGHTVNVCSKVVSEIVGISTPSVVPRMVNQGNDKSETDGFTEVRRNGRRMEPTKQVVFAAGGSSSGQNHGRNLREITVRKDSEIIEISNRYGELDKDNESVEEREDVLLLEENKENNSGMNIAKQGNRFNLKDGGNIMGSNGKGKVMGKGGLPQRKADIKKTNVVNGPKPKQTKVIRPTRGLIFGPTSKEITLSESGKRLRVEHESLGRPGGVFSTDLIGEVMVVTSTQRNEDIETAESMRLEESSVVVRNTSIEPPLDGVAQMSA